MQRGYQFLMKVLLSAFVIISRLAWNKCVVLVEIREKNKTEQVISILGHQTYHCQLPSKLNYEQGI